MLSRSVSDVLPPVCPPRFPPPLECLCPPGSRLAHVGVLRRVDASGHPGGAVLQTRLAALVPRARVHAGQAGARAVLLFMQYWPCTIIHAMLIFMQYYSCHAMRAMCCMPYYACRAIHATLLMQGYSFRNIAPAAVESAVHCSMSSGVFLSFSKLMCDCGW